MNDVRRLSQLALAGLIVGLLVLGGLAWRDGPAWPGVERRLLSAQQPSPAPPATSEPDAAAPAPCRVVGSPLVSVSDEKVPTAWSELQNVGSAPAHLSLLQMGWNGRATLTAVSIEDADGGTMPLFVGHAESPARIALAAADPKLPESAIAPGTSVRLNLSFEADDPQQPLELGPAAVFFSEGCSLALSQPEGSDCGLSIMNVGPSGNDPRRIVFSVVNKGRVPTRINAFDVRWPSEVNGGLTALYLDGVLRYRFAESLANSPATVKLNKLLGEPVTLEPNRPLAVWLEFEKGVAAEPYVITAATADGCLATGSTWLDTSSCGVVTNGFATRGARAVLRLTNSMPVTQTVYALDLFWPSGANGPLVEAIWDGSSIWRGREETVPATLMLGQSARIARDETATLELVFDPPAPGVDATQSSIASGDYVAIFSLRGGCQLVFTDRHASAPGCSISAGDLAPRQGQPEVAVSLSNSGGDALLRRLEFSWPVRNGALTGIWLGSTALFQGTEAPADEPFVLELPRGSEPPLNRNTTAPIRLRFADRASRLGYGLSMSFLDGDGNACADLLVTPPQGELDCRLAITRVSGESERDVEIYVTNNGHDEVELRFINVEWPTNIGRNRLVSAHMVDRDSEFLLWSGEARVSPARIPFTAARAAVVDPGEVARIRLHYDQLVGVSDPAQEFRATIGTAEGCQATYPDDSQQILPERRSFSGMILNLPTGSLWGPWTIARQQGSTRDTVVVEVSDATRLEPASVRAQVGDVVHVDAIAYDGQLHAEKVVFLSPEEMVQLIGTIVEVDPMGASGARPEWIRLSAVPQAIRITTDTHIDGRLDVGARVKVEGTSDTLGKITAVRITRQAAPVDEIVTIRGAVQSAQRSDSESLVQLWTVGRYRVRVDMSRPESRWADPPYDRTPVLGSQVEIHGRLNGTDIEAVSVTLLDPPRTRRLRGLVTRLPDGGMLGTWELRLADGSAVEFLVQSTAVVDARSAPAATGVYADAIVQDVGGGQVALSVRTDWPD